MGHEFTGIVVETGSEVKTVQKGDKIVSPFTTSWYAMSKWGEVGDEWSACG